MSRLLRVTQISRYPFRQFYVQGQPGKRKDEREYFYKINHQGQLFMDDAKVKNFITCFKDPVFLKFFYPKIRPIREREVGYEDMGFTWVSPCGPETNYIKDEIKFRLAPDCI